jgi:hypothetical protein
MWPVAWNPGGSGGHSGYGGYLRGSAQQLYPRRTGGDSHQREERYKNLLVKRQKIGNYGLWPIRYFEGMRHRIEGNAI